MSSDPVTPSSSSSRVTRSIAVKLILAFVLLGIIGGGIASYTLIRAASRNLMNDAVVYTRSFSELTKKSIRYGMLTFNREAIQQTVESIGTAEHVKRIRIFDNRGKIFYSSNPAEVGDQVDRRFPACIGCHGDPERPLETLTSDSQWVIARADGSQRVLTFVDPMYNDPSCSTAACHAHPRNQKVLGVLETDFSLVSVDRSIRKQTMDILVDAVVFMALGSVIVYFILRKFILQPVSTLSGAMKKVAAGDLSQKVSLASEDEMGLLARSFNVMTGDLERARETREHWTQTLEEEVAKKSDELKKSQDKLIQAEKLAALGRLTSDVAHEIRNPLTALGGFAHRLRKIVDDPKEKEYAEVMVSEVNRLEQILRDVLTFSRDARFHLERHRIEEFVWEVVKTYRDLCAEQSVRLDVAVEEDLMPLLIDREQLRQAVHNLMTNAIDALPRGGTIGITAGKEIVQDVPYVFLRVSDTGGGIPEEKLPLIFEPFFSTKEIGHGTGLGLSITRKIIEEHGGFIKAESTVGEGSAFSLYLPFQSEEESRKTPCWEFMQCGRDRDSSMKCPAYPNFGRICWVVAGTFCEGKVQGTFAQKCEDCRKCEFYQRVKEKQI